MSTASEAAAQLARITAATRSSGSGVTVKPAALTEYVVLRELDSGYTLHRAVKATSAEAAVKEACDGKAGVYVAIPARSWKPVTVKLETVTTIKLEA